MSSQHKKRGFRNQFEGGRTSANTSVFIGGPSRYTNSESITKQFNDRKKFLEEEGWANTWDPIQDELQYLGFGEAEIGGINIKDINAELERENNGELTVINSLPMKYAVRDIREDEGVGQYGHTKDLLNAGVNMVNPNDFVRFSANKRMHYEAFDDKLGTIPYFEVTSNFDSVQEMREDFEKEGLDNLPKFAQPIVGSLGNNVGFHYHDDLMNQLEEIEEHGGNVPSYLIQVPLPHVADTRVLSFGDTPVVAERRVGDPETDICNLSKVDGIKEMSGQEIIDGGYAEPIDIDSLDPAYENIIKDHYPVIQQETLIDGERAEAFIGWDVLEIDLGMDEKGYLSAYQDARGLEDLLFERYKTEDGNYLVLGEINSRPGGGIERMAASEHPHQSGALGLLMGADASLARGLEFERLSEDKLAEADEYAIKSYFEKG